MITVGVAIIFSESAVTRGAGFSVIISSLAINLLGCFFPVAFLMGAAKKRMLIGDQRHTALIILPIFLLLAWTLFKFVFWTQPTDSPVNSSEFMFYLMSPLIMFFIVLFWIVSNAQKKIGEMQSPLPQIIETTTPTPSLHEKSITFPPRSMSRKSHSIVINSASPVKDHSNWITIAPKNISTPNTTITSIPTPFNSNINMNTNAGINTTIASSTNSLANITTNKGKNRFGFKHSKLKNSRFQNLRDEDFL